MAIPTMRKIQQHNNDVLCDSQTENGPPPGLRAGGGAYTERVKGEPLGAWLTCRPRWRHQQSMNNKRTSLSVLFDMVAELAIAER
eukprot:3154243-Amphidinium_carterae.1